MRVISRPAARAVLSGVTGSTPRTDLVAAARVLVVAAIVFANVIGSAIVLLLIGVVLPIPEAAERAAGVAGVSVLGGALYISGAVTAGTVAGLRLARPVIAFALADRTPTAEDRRAVLGLPVLLLRLQFALWLGGAVAFGAIALDASTLYGFEVAITVVLAAIPSASIAFLLTQRLLRVFAARVLAAAPPRHHEVPGVGARAVLAWTLGAMPAAGVLVLAAFAGPTDNVTVSELAAATIALTLVTLAVGLIAIVIFARSVADPLSRLRDAFGRVEQGDLDVEIPVFDATEVGYAAAGFNRMAAGLRERERLRDLFGRQVGEDVARQALEQGVSLGGEERQAVALFVDVIGSTRFAATRSPTEVVEALNAFFGVVVDATIAHGGTVNKFVGDAALCIFGAPLQQEDAAGAALAAARAMAGRLSGGTLDAAVGVAAGTVVAGNIGTTDRYEYTVIGDPVNEAARLTELAKERAGRVLASEAALRAAAPGEAARWALGDPVQLRGRAEPTRLAEPRAGAQ